MNYHLSILFFSESWAEDENIDKISLFLLETCNLIHQIRNDCLGGDLHNFFHKIISFKLRPHLNINLEDPYLPDWVFSIEIMNKTAKKIVLNIFYWLTHGRWFKKNVKLALKNFIIRSRKKQCNTRKWNDFNIKRKV